MNKFKKISEQKNLKFLFNLRKYTKYYKKLEFPIYGSDLRDCLHVDYQGVYLELSDKYNEQI